MLDGDASITHQRCHGENCAGDDWRGIESGGRMAACQVSTEGSAVREPEFVLDEPKSLSDVVCGFELPGAAEKSFENFLRTSGARRSK